MNNRPEKIWIRGSPIWNRGPTETKYRFITIIGSRKGTKYGYDACKTIMSGLQDTPCAIVSGLAYGIDVEAHKNALALNLPCVGIPGSGIDDGSIYPKEHLSLAKNIIENGGALLSEFPLGTKAQKWTFPLRNRLMAAMSDLILIIEAGESSGTFITALQALELGKTIAAVPGPIDSPLSRGPHKLIKNGAFPVTCSKDVLELINLT